MNNLSHIVARNRDKVMQFAHTMKRPFPIEQEDADQLPTLLEQLPTLTDAQVAESGWRLTASLPSVEIPERWRQFIIPGLGYAYIHGRTELGRFRQGHADYRGLGVR